MEKKSMAVPVETREKELTTWDPLRLIDEMFGGITMPLTALTAERAWTPKTDVQETEKEYILTASLPGLRPARTASSP